MLRVQHIKTEWFNNHKATLKKLDEDTSIMTWANPKEYAYAMTFILHKHTITVLGDCGAAVYVLSETADITKINKGYDCYYFTSKLTTAQSGRTSFNTVQARKGLTEWKDRLLAISSQELVPKVKRMYKTLLQEAENCSTVATWQHTLLQYSHELSEIDVEWSNLCDIGTDLNSHVLGYWVALKMACEQLCEGVET